MNRLRDEAQIELYEVRQLRQRVDSLNSEMVSLADRMASLNDRCSFLDNVIIVRLSR